eukprot:CAMPEP_0119419464 /NCGR_PEP_ID=MMETSP1335-20130426/20932_1 /TAXON_ID=259385 /ORGANISM="Chrysoculter rhomboideus, Strain RCC1486" /LENGTH=284 /DNA_ID=CAMNT_0007444773 /DNA_START=106 /DNA_END=956 /DNA_ORIENTATION=-
MATATGSCAPALQNTAILPDRVAQCPDRCLPQGPPPASRRSELRRPTQPRAHYSLDLRACAVLGQRAEQLVVLRVRRDADGRCDGRVHREHEDLDRRAGRHAVRLVLDGHGRDLRRDSIRGALHDVQRRLHVGPLGREHRRVRHAQAGHEGLAAVLREERAQVVERRFDGRHARRVRVHADDRAQRRARRGRALQHPDRLRARQVFHVPAVDEPRARERAAALAERQRQRCVRRARRHVGEVRDGGGRAEADQPHQALQPLEEVVEGRALADERLAEREACRAL